MNIFRWHRFLPATANVQFSRCYLNRDPRRTGVPEHTGSLPQKKGAALTPCLKAGHPRRIR
jgi:hypothetical protein